MRLVTALLSSLRNTQHTTQHATTGASPPHLTSMLASHSSHSVSSSSSTRAEYARDLPHAVELLRQGELVAFPTETVYGLGADANNETALANVFKVKGRPRTDPLIVHVDALPAAESLLSLNQEGLTLLRRLATDFWPGPLTVVATARPSVSPLLTAGTGQLGVRCPSHALARRLIAASGLPIAAPSANRFGHVSPTRPEHVMADLGDSRVFILRDEPESSCEVGIESTVLKIDEEARQLVLLRRGGVPEAILERWAREHAGGYTVRSKPPPSVAAAAATAAAKASADVAASAEAAPAEEQAQQAPGMLLTHYAPDVPTFLLRREATDDEACPPLATSVLLDFGGRAASLSTRCGAYRDLSPSADAAAAAATVFEALRWAEGRGCACVLLPDVMGARDGAANAEGLPALADRLYRASSGRVRRFPVE